MDTSPFAPGVDGMDGTEGVARRDGGFVEAAAGGASLPDGTRDDVEVDETSARISLTSRE